MIVAVERVAITVPEARLMSQKMATSVLMYFFGIKSRMICPFETGFTNVQDGVPAPVK